MMLESGNVAMFRFSIEEYDIECRRLTSSINGGLTCAIFFDVIRYLTWLSKIVFWDKEMALNPWLQSAQARSVFATATVSQILSEGYRDRTLSWLGSLAHPINPRWERLSKCEWGMHMVHNGTDSQIKGAHVPPLVRNFSGKQFYNQSMFEDCFDEPLANLNSLASTEDGQVMPQTSDGAPQRLTVAEVSQPLFLESTNNGMDDISMLGWYHAKDGQSSHRKFGDLVEVGGYNQKWLQVSPCLEVTGGQCGAVGSTFSMWSDIIQRQVALERLPDTVQFSTSSLPQKAEMATKVSPSSTHQKPSSHNVAVKLNTYTLQPTKRTTPFPQLVSTDYDSPSCFVNLAVPPPSRSAPYPPPSTAPIPSYFIRVVFILPHFVSYPLMHLHFTVHLSTFFPYVLSRLCLPKVPYLWDIHCIEDVD
jgi:hypothetical protein